MEEIQIRVRVVSFLFDVSIHRETSVTFLPVHNLSERKGTADDNYLGISYYVTISELIGQRQPTATKQTMREGIYLTTGRLQLFHHCTHRDGAERGMDTVRGYPGQSSSKDHSSLATVLRAADTR